MSAIGPHFANELDAAGLLGLPFTWGDDGTFTFGEGMTDVQRSAILALFAAHNPNDTTKVDAALEARQLAAFEGAKLVKALAIWTAGKLGIPATTARSEILAIYRGLL